MGGFNVLLPIVAEQSGKSKPVPFGWALYGADWPMDRQHALMAKGHRVQNWYVRDCCIPYSNFLPYLRGRDYVVPMDDVRRMAAEHPGRTWCLWNEPDYPNQDRTSPADALAQTAEWVAAIKAYNGKVAGYGVGMQPGYTGWRNWLDEWLQIGGALPDYWHIHIYATNAVEWHGLYGGWQVWNAEHGALPTIISEAGGDLNEDGSTHGWYGIYHFLRQWIDDRVLGVYLFTDKPQLYQDVGV